MYKKKFSGATKFRVRLVTALLGRVKAILVAVRFEASVVKALKACEIVGSRTGTPVEVWL